MALGTKPKKFRCANCNHETYTDSDNCKGCSLEGTIKPIPKELYKCYLNDVIYGSGDLNYIHELIKDYLLNHNMYGKSKCNFEIVKDTVVGNKKTFE